MRCRRLNCDSMRRAAAGGCRFRHMSTSFMSPRGSSYRRDNLNAAYRQTRVEQHDGVLAASAASRDGRTTSTRRQPERSTTSAGTVRCHARPHASIDPASRAIGRASSCIQLLPRSFGSAQRRAHHPSRGPTVGRRVVTARAGGSRRLGTRGSACRGWPQSRPDGRGDVCMPGGRGGRGSCPR